MVFFCGVAAQKCRKNVGFILNKLDTFPTFPRGYPAEKLIAEQSAEAHCSFRVGKTSKILAKLSYLLEEPSYLPAELQILVPKPDLAQGLFLRGSRAEKLIAEQSAEAHCSFRVGTISEYLA